ncbi:hypothetical protein COBT_000024 [Conglomerata obtusa]
MKHSNETTVSNLLNERSQTALRTVEIEIEDDGSYPKCKICFLYKNPIDSTCDLIAPCGCKGSIKYVHKTCLRLWRFKGKHIREIKKCEQCCCEYRIAEDFLPHLMLVRLTAILSILAILFTAKFVISTAGDAIAFLMDVSYLDEHLFYSNNLKDAFYYECIRNENAKLDNHGESSFSEQATIDTNNTQYNTQEEDVNSKYKNKINPEKKNEKTNDQETIAINKSNSNIKKKNYNKQSFENILRNLYHKQNNLHASGVKLYEKSIYCIKKYLENRTYRDEFSVSLYSATIIILVFYVFTCCWSFWPVINFYFTLYRVYYLDFTIDKLLLLTINCYYLRRMYLDLFQHIDALYVFALNYRC